MASYPHREQVSTCPPSSAVRQRRMASTTFICTQVSQPKLRCDKAGSAARMTSATSIGGRDIYFVGDFVPVLNNGSASRGLAVACRCRVETCR